MWFFRDWAFDIQQSGYSGKLGYSMVSTQGYSTGCPVNTFDKVKKFNVVRCLSLFPLERIVVE